VTRALTIAIDAASDGMLTSDDRNMTRDDRQPYD